MPANDAIGVRIGTGKSTRQQAYQAIAGHQDRNDWLTNARRDGLRAGLPVIAAACGDGQGLFLIGVVTSDERVDRTIEERGVNWKYRHHVEWDKNVYSARPEGVLERIVARRALVWLTGAEFEEAKAALSVSPAAMAGVAAARRQLAARPGSG